MKHETASDLEKILERKKLQNQALEKMIASITKSNKN